MRQFRNPSPAPPLVAISQPFWLTKKSSRNCFFFSSRIRHTRLTCDWSSDVCSSDLLQGDLCAEPGGLDDRVDDVLHSRRCRRSEERRGGKEWRSRGAPIDLKKNREDVRRGQQVV